MNDTEFERNGMTVSDMWARRDAVLAAQERARFADVFDSGRSGMLMRAALASSDDVPALLDTIADLRGELATARDQLIKMRRGYWTNEAHNV